MNLKEGKNRYSYTVLDIELERGLERRLEALGLTRGARVQILNNDKKGAMTVRFRGTRFALGQRIARHILVKEGDENE
ncbi:MAG TPA: ferrous iron transport protein A [Candidatus Bariatricus faecipullorum]|nr:ferrous iron transport protein A [Candidatus Bariatricus faecipullorum]